MYSFFQYTPVVNYGSKVDYAAFTYHNIRIDDGMWKDDRTWIDGGRWRNICCGMDKCGKLPTILLNPVYPLHTEGIITKGRDELYTLSNEIQK